MNVFHLHNEQQMAGQLALFGYAIGPRWRGIRRKDLSVCFYDIRINRKPVMSHETVTSALIMQPIAC